MALPDPQPAEPARTRYRLLGPLTAVRGDAGAEIDLGPPKQRSVLGLLLLHRGSVVSVDRLVDAVWPEDAPPSVAASLQAYVSNLRRLLRDDQDGPPPIVRRAPGYLLEVGDDQLDLAAFAAEARAARTALALKRWAEALEAADRALARSGGPLLEDLAGEQWVRAEADRVADVLAEVHETRTEALLGVGAVAEAVRQAQALHAEQPHRDRSCWLHMVALHRAGRSPEALERFREHARRLDDELGLEPGAELRELQVAILRQDPALAAWPRSPGWSGAQAVAGPAAAEPVEALALPSSDDGAEALVGRARETEEIDRLRAEVAAQQARWLLLTGPAGIGKTRLAQEVVRRMERAGGRDVWARCPEEAGAPAWWPVRQIVRALGGDPEVVLVPPPGVDSDEARFAVYERVVALLEQAAAEAPVTVVVDDVQWADATSVLCLAFVAGALRGRRVAFVLTYRDGEDDAAVQPLLAAVARSPGHRQLAVGPLGDAAVRELADSVAATPLVAAEAAALAERTRGNPLFVREYARLAPEERAGGGIPLAVRSVLGRRLVGLEPEVLQLLRTAAVIDDVLDVEVIAATTRMEPGAVADIFDAAADDGLLVAAPGTGGYAFAHGLLREEVVRGIPALRRQRLHLRVAEVLAARGEAPSRRAQHLLLALPLADPADVLAACRVAAVDATERFSSETAARWWKEALRAFDLLPAGVRVARERDDLLVARVEALARAGRGQAVLDVVEHGLLDAVRDGRTSAAGRLAASLLRASGGWPWVSSGDPGPLLGRLEAVEPLLEADPAAQARVLAALAVAGTYNPDPRVADGRSRGAIALAERLGDPDVLADALLGRSLTYSGIATHCEESLQLLERLRELPHELSRVDAAAAHSVASMATMMRGEVGAAAEHVRRGIAEADLLRLPVVRVQLRWMEALLAQWRGDFEDADRRIAVAADVHRQSELYQSAAAHAVVRLILAWERGTLAQSEVEPILEPVAWAAAFAAARGDADEAARQLERWVADPGPMVWTTLGHATLLAHVAADLGLTGPAAGLAAFLAPHEHRIAIVGQCVSTGAVALAAARLQHLLGQLGRAAELLAQARQLAEATGGRPTLLRCRLLAEELAPEAPGRAERLAALADEAEEVGMLGVARAARS